ncbi:sensor domain-containing protein [Antrihabitans spumae]|uniref:Sensor domain-containing protein n=1 Tax=Antrihabitans spumae TaxID=3373370 RepID=A0ABW7KJE8_9NOCA
MRAAHSMAVCAAVSVVLVGCSDDQPTPSQTVDSLGAVVAAPTAITAPPITDSAALRALLLTRADLPPGFSPLADPTIDLGLPPAPDGPDKARTDPAQCSAVLEPLAAQRTGATADGAARFAGPDFTSIDVDAASYSIDAAADAFTRVQQTLRECASYSGTDADGVAVDYRIGALDQPTSGDASTAFRILTESDGITLTTDAVLTIVGSTVVQLTASGQEPIDPAVLTGLVARQVDRLRTPPQT